MTSCLKLHMLTERKLSTSRLFTHIVSTEKMRKERKY